MSFNAKGQSFATFTPGHDPLQVRCEMDPIRPYLQPFPPHHSRSAQETWSTWAAEACHFRQRQFWALPSDHSQYLDDFRPLLSLRI